MSEKPLYHGPGRKLGSLSLIQPVRRIIRAGLIKHFFSAILLLFFWANLTGCGGETKEEVKLGFEFKEAVHLGMRGFELSTPSIYPDQEYGGVYISGGNVNTIFRYHPMEGLNTYIEPVEVPSDARGVGAFCYADGDFFFRPVVPPEPNVGGLPAVYQLTRQGRIRLYELPDEAFEEVRDLGVIVYIGDGKLLFETTPRGPFATVDMVTGEALRHPTEPPPREAVQTLVPDFGAREIYVVRRAKDMSIYFLRYSFDGSYRGPAYIHRREFLAAAASSGDVHFIQYASGMVDTYDFRFTQTGSFDFRKLAPPGYKIFLGFTIVWDMAYLVGQRGPVGSPKGYDLLVFRMVKGKKSKDRR
jgi:hypothetical protein